MDQTDRDTEGMQGDGVRDDAADTADARAKAGDATSRTSRDAMEGRRDQSGGGAADAHDEPDGV